MDYSKYKLFDNQPTITKELLKDLEKTGLIVPKMNQEFSLRRVTPRRNFNAGSVVNYNALCDAIKLGKVTQSVARALIVIEVTRTHGNPRENVIGRLMVLAFKESKTEILDKIKQIRKNG